MNESDHIYGSPYRVLVCGSRTFTDSRIVTEVLLGAYDLHSMGWLTLHVMPFVVVHGAARGADTFAGEWARAVGPHPGPDFNQDMAPPVVEEAHPANWKLQGAGPRRNQEMLATSLDVVYAFVNKPLNESKGTADMVRRCRAAKVRTYVTYAPHAVPEPKEAWHGVTGL